MMQYQRPWGHWQPQRQLWPGIGNWYSVGQISIGRQYAEQIDQLKLIKGPGDHGVHQPAGSEPGAEFRFRVPFTIQVIDSTRSMRSLCRSGFFYVNTGLILAADNEAEVAGVMAHVKSRTWPPATSHVSKPVARWLNLPPSPSS
jgi:hypothetical protein